MNEMQKRLAQASVPFIREAVKILRETYDERKKRVTTKEADFLHRKCVSIMADLGQISTGGPMGTLQESMDFIVLKIAQGRDGNLAMYDYFEHMADRFEKGLAGPDMEGIPLEEQFDIVERAIESDWTGEKEG